MTIILTMEETVNLLKKGLTEWHGDLLKGAGIDKYDSATFDVDLMANTPNRFATITKHYEQGLEGEHAGTITIPYTE